MIFNISLFNNVQNKILLKKTQKRKKWIYTDYASDTIIFIKTYFI